MQWFIWEATMLHRKIWEATVLRKNSIKTRQYEVYDVIEFYADTKCAESTLERIPFTRFFPVTCINKHYSAFEDYIFSFVILLGQDNFFFRISSAWLTMESMWKSLKNGSFLEFSPTRQNLFLCGAWSSFLVCWVELVFCHILVEHGNLCFSVEHGPF